MLPLSYPRLVEHIRHLVDPVQQDIHLTLHVLPLPLRFLYRVLEHLQISSLSHHLLLSRLLVRLDPDQLGLNNPVNQLFF